MEKENKTHTAATKHELEGRLLLRHLSSAQKGTAELQRIVQSAHIVLFLLPKVCSWDILWLERCSSIKTHLSALWGSLCFAGEAPDAAATAPWAHGVATAGWAAAALPAACGAVMYVPCPENSCASLL